MKADYKKSFIINDESPLYVPAFLLNNIKWSDNSWHNDSCPNFVAALSDELYIVWVDYDLPEQRDSACADKYTICFRNSDYLNDEPSQNIFNTDSETDLIKFLTEKGVI